jgi:hypothetical protein
MVNPSEKSAAAIVSMIAAYHAPSTDRDGLHQWVKLTKRAFLLVRATMPDTAVQDRLVKLRSYIHLAHRASGQCVESSASQKHRH